MSLISLVGMNLVVRVKSILITCLLRLKGATVGRNVIFYTVPFFRIRGKWNNLIIGNDCRFMIHTEISNRENGKIVISNGVVIDSNTRILAANDAELFIGKHVTVGMGTIINAGVNVFIGNNTLLGGYCYLQTSNHGYKKSSLIRTQDYDHGEIVIEDDVWLASHVTVMSGSIIQKGAVVGAKSVVNKLIPSYSINVGTPAKTIKMRE